MNLNKARSMRLAGEAVVKQIPDDILQRFRSRQSLNDAESLNGDPEHLMIPDDSPAKKPGRRLRM